MKSNIVLINLSSWWSITNRFHLKIRLIYSKIHSRSLAVSALPDLLPGSGGHHHSAVLWQWLLGLEHHIFLRPDCVERRNQALAILVLHSSLARHCCMSHRPVCKMNETDMRMKRNAIFVKIKRIHAKSREYIENR